MNSPTTTQKNETAKAERQGEQIQLTRRYGSIGIEAVAAAAQFADRRKSSQSQTAAPRIDQRFVESAS